MISNEIDDKYEIIKILQKTAATAVLLVKEKPVGDIRILKAIHKSHPDSARILTEANLLSEINSPKIPTIFNVGQISDWNYLVEEYIDGQPLQDFLLENKPVQFERILQILIQLCEIMYLLHISDEDPILYRDMKPEHVIVKESEIRLIDFGASCKASETEKANCYCSKSFASPEQLMCKKQDVRSDVYGIGKVIEYCELYMDRNDYKKLKKIANAATKEDVRKRISSVKELQLQLVALRGNKGDEKLRVKYLDKSIAVAGSESGVGCTHISINLCKYLNVKGLESYFRDMTGQNTVQRLSNNLNSYILKDGILYHEGFKGIMEYGTAVEAMIPPKGNQILDYGRVDEKPIADIVLYVIGLRPWMELEELPVWINDRNVIIISNMGNLLSTLEYSKMISKKIYLYCEYSRPFRIKHKEKKLFEIIKKEIEH